MFEVGEKVFLKKCKSLECYLDVIWKFGNTPDVYYKPHTISKVGQRHSGTFYTIRVDGYDLKIREDELIKLVSVDLGAWI